MYKYLYCIAALSVFLFTPSCKKDLLHWQRIQQLNSNTSASLNTIHFIDNTACFIGGGIMWNQTTVLQSADGGYTFSPASNPPFSIEMAGYSVSSFGGLYMCGAHGTVISSSDTGKTWKLRMVSNSGYYVGIAFPRPDTGILITTLLQQAGTIVKVDSNLNIVSQQNFKLGFNVIYMINEKAGYIAGYGGVLKTIDGGITWNFLNVKGDNFMAMDIHGDEIWMCGYIGCVYHSIDGGNNWERLRNGNDITIPHYNLMSIVFKDELNGWASCDDGRVIHTDDGGHHWEEYDRFTTNSLRSIVLCPNGDLLTSGDNGALYRITP